MARSALMKANTAIRIWTMAATAIFASTAGGVAADPGLREPFFAPFEKIETRSRFVRGGYKYKLHHGIDPARAIVIVYTHGSAGDTKTDTCHFRRYVPLIDQERGNGFVPRIFRALRPEDRRIAIFYVCHEEVGDQDPEPTGKSLERFRPTPCNKAGSRDPKENGNQAKVCKRARRIRYEVEQIQRSNPGLPTSNIFLSGGSAGGWASLLLKSLVPEVESGVIAFAPATFGEISAVLNKIDNRDPGRRERILARLNCGDDHEIHYLNGVTEAKDLLRHKCQMKFIADNVTSALIFAYAKDPYNDPEILADFEDRNNIDFVPVEAKLLKRRCGFRFPWTSNRLYHACQHGAGFTRAYRDRIRKFIGSRITE